MKKLSNKLGSQWKKDELVRFYEAYRKYGKDWEKVAADVGSRSVEMVEALYNWNQEESDSERTETINEEMTLSKLKRRRVNVSHPRAIGKRTPRVPVNYSYRKDDWGNYVSSNKTNMDSAFDANDDDEVAHVETVTLTRAAQRDGSPKASQIPYKRSEQKSSPVHRRIKLLYAISVDEDCLEGSMERRNMEDIKDHKKGGNNYRKKEQGETVRTHLLDGGGGACSGTKEGLDFCLKEKIDIDAMNSKLKKRPRESSTRLKEERMTVDNDEKFVLPESTSSSQNKSEAKLPHSNQKTSRTVYGSKLVKESKEKILSTDKTRKRKGKSTVSKAIDEENNPVIMEKHIDQNFSLAKQLKLARSLESSLPGDQKYLRVSTSDIPLVSEVNLASKQRSRRKRGFLRTFMPSETILKWQPKMCLTSVQDKAIFVKDKLSNCLSSYMVRRWCVFEWFYSPIDYPWFSKREFSEYLNLVDLGNITRLTRAEWSVIRSSLGRPRRFCERFLHEERQKLEQYRRSVREYYTEIRAGNKDGLPRDLPKPFYVGQLVIALNSKTGEIHDGIVLTVDHDKCMVQFDHPGLGEEFIMDIDCMPLNPFDNMPETLRMQFGVLLQKKLPMEFQNTSGDKVENQNDIFKDSETLTQELVE
ncbi:hypothetical protein KIW84_030548 [Lathyrus oleraceus]|uniref:SANT domain-containing protein n=1 Tax=Pisum sativum TaxID=3888 RepID=A0A9D4XQQ8_PEA|nr:hypothetical protein KIW84_030548 [Pisum sativum]